MVNYRICEGQSQAFGRVQPLCVRPFLFFHRRRGLQVQLQVLIELQQVELRLTEIERLREQLPQDIESIEIEINNDKADLEALSNKLEDLQKERRSKEGALNTGLEKVKKYEAQLFSVKTNKEYQALLNEIAAIKASNDRMEEDIIVLMEQIDEMRVNLKRREEEFNRYRQKHQQKKEAIIQELQGFEKEIKKKMKISESLIKQCDKNILSHYRKVIAKGNGLAMVAVINGICQGCYINIPPQLSNEVLRQNALITCPYCQRILYPKTNDEKS